jgi:hypothetical protein
MSAAFQEYNVKVLSKFLSKLFSLPSKVIKKTSSSSSLQNIILIGRWALEYDSNVQVKKKMTQKIMNTFYPTLYK